MIPCASTNNRPADVSSIPHVESMPGKRSCRRIVPVAASIRATYIDPNTPYETVTWSPAAVSTWHEPGRCTSGARARVLIVDAVQHFHIARPQRVAAHGETGVGGPDLGDGDAPVDAVRALVDAHEFGRRRDPDVAADDLYRLGDRVRQRDAGNDGVPCCDRSARCSARGPPRPMLRRSRRRWTCCRGRVHRP